LQISFELVVSNCLQKHISYTKFVKLGVLCIAIEVYSIVGLCVCSVYEIAGCKVEDNYIVVFLHGERKCLDCIRCTIECD